MAAPRFCSPGTHRQFLAKACCNSGAVSFCSSSAWAIQQGSTPLAMLNFLSELQEPPLHFRIFRKPFNVNQNCAMHDDKLHTVPRLELLGNLHQILFQRRDWTFGIASRYGDSENPEDSPFGFVLLLLLDSRWLVSYRCCAARIVLRLFQTLQTLKPWSCLKTLWKQRFDSYRLMIHSLNPIPHNSANSSTLEFLHKVFESLLQALQSKHRSIFVGGDAELQFDICSIWCQSVHVQPRSPHMIESALSTLSCHERHWGSRRRDVSHSKLRTVLVATWPLRLQGKQVKRQDQIPKDI